jgi:hypothetical protein
LHTEINRLPPGSAADGAIRFVSGSFRRAKAMISIFQILWKRQLADKASAVVTPRSSVWHTRIANNMHERIERDEDNQPDFGCDHDDHGLWTPHDEQWLHLPNL